MEVSWVNDDIIDWCKEFVRPYLPPLKSYARCVIKVDV